jgi:hypothetical protein
VKKEKAKHVVCFVGIGFQSLFGMKKKREKKPKENRPWDLMTRIEGGFVSVFFFVHHRPASV